MWRLPIAYGLFVAGVCSAIVTTLEPGAEEVRAVIRATAFTSSVPFLLLYLAAPLHRLQPSAATRWLLANRRYLGLSVAASHLWHLIAILVVVNVYATAPVARVTLVFGTAGFVLLGLMAATSTDGAQRALGRGWHWLHRVGLHVLWLDFVFTYMGTALVAPFHAIMTVAFLAVWSLRIIAWVSAR
jgi:DMSO/TMAO reductase YedYZ heme-binding membrane subunit